MSKLDTNHVVNLDLVKDRVNSVIKFGLADVETSDFYLGLYNNGSRVFDKDYIVTLYIVKPNGTFRNIKLEPKEGLKKYYCNLPDTLKNIAGEYVCQVMVFDNLTGEKKISKSKFKYSVSVDLASEMAGIIDEEEQESILTNILNRLLTLENPVEPYATQKHVDECVSTLTEEIDTIKVKDVEQDERLVNIESKNNEQDGRLNAVETKNNEQDNRLDIIEAKDIEQDNRLVNIETKNTEQDDRLNTIESKDIEQDERLNNIETKNTEQDGRLDIAENRLNNIGNDITNTMQPIIDEHTSRLDAIEAIDVAQNNRLNAIESKNTEQDNRLLDIEKVNKKQDIDIKCLYGASQTIDVTEEGNSIHLQNSNNGFAVIDEIKGNTLVNCNKEADKELILNGNINTSGDNTVTLTEGVNGGKVDVALEGNTLVNVSKTKDSTAISKAYTVENSGNHIALQGDIDGSCRPVVTGKTLVNLWNNGDLVSNYVWAKNIKSPLLKPNTIYTIKCDYTRTNEEVVSSQGNIVLRGTNNVYMIHCEEETISTFTTPSDYNDSYDILYYGSTLGVTTYSNIILLEGDYTDKPIPDYFEGLQSSFEDNLVTQEMVDSGEEIADNLGKYRVDYKSTREDGRAGNTKTLYLNSPLLEGDTIEEREDGIYHVHKYTKVVLDGVTNSGMRKERNGQFNTDRTMLKVPYFREDIKEISPSTKYDNSFCDKLCWKPDIPNKASDTPCYSRGGSYWRLMISIPVTTDSESVINAYLQSNPLTFVLPLKIPQYELIEQSNLAIPSYANGHLDFNTAVPVEKVDFLPFSEELVYLYANTQYTIQFVSNKATTVNITLGGTQLLAQSIVAGLNRIIVTTPTTLVDNKLIIDGVGAKIEKVVVTDTDRKFSYFEGMKSVGEGGTLEVVSCNKNLFNGKWELNEAKTLKTTDFIKINNNVVTCYMPGYTKSNGARYLTAILYDENKSLIKYHALGDGSACYSFDNLGNFSYLKIMMSTTLTDCDFDVYDYKISNYIYYKGEHIPHQSNTQQLTHEPLRAVGDKRDRYVLIDGKWYIERNCGIRAYQEEDKNNYKTDLVNTVYPLEMPTYEEIDYNPLEVYAGTTHITTNSAIPTNITIKNHGFNCLLKPSTTYTISSNLGLNTVTTPSTLTEDCLRFMDTDTSDVTTMKDVLVLEGDWTTKADLIPATFSGIESAFEQELVIDENDEHYGKYRVTAKVVGKNLFHGQMYDGWLNNGQIIWSNQWKYSDYIQVPANTKIALSPYYDLAEYDYNKKYIKTHNNERVMTTSSNCYYVRIGMRNPVDMSKFQIEIGDTATTYEPYKENNITFYINEPLRGVETAKDKVYVKDDKVVVERNCGIRPYEDGDFGTYPTDKVNTVYQLAEPTYEEVEYNDTKLFIESFKNSTLFYNSNVPVTSKLHYSYSVPIVDTVAQTANISDQQDSMIIDLATQCAVMEIMLM